MIENKLNKKARIIHKDFHPAYMKATWADISKAKNLLGWEPEEKLEEGIEKTIKWYLENKYWIEHISV